jgi:methionyl-tRNA formyltransferase
MNPPVCIPVSCNSPRTKRPEDRTADVPVRSMSGSERRPTGSAASAVAAAADEDVRGPSGEAGGALLADRSASKVPGVLFLASCTARSQAYAQALSHHGLEPEHVVLFGQPPARPPSFEAPPAAAIPSELFLPDLSVPLEQSCRDWPVTRVAAGDVNAPEVAAAVAERQPRVIVYAGYGGQIVREGILGLEAPVLHAHAGWLPDERGSTTIYYSLLKGGECGVTVFCLRREIDTGPMLARRRYPRPHPAMNIDHLYDNAIRADLLIRVLRVYASTGQLPPGEPQSGDEGATYYVIHPVLKHLAILSLSHPA